MALLQNIVFLSQYPLKQRGAILTQEKSFFNRSDEQMNKYCSDGNTLSNKSGIPNGYEAPYSWSWPIKAGGLSAYTSVNGTGALTSTSFSQGVALTSLAPRILGQGVVTSSLTMIVQLLTDLSGDCSLTATMQSAMRMAADLVGEGDVSGALGLIAWCISDITGSGTADGSILRGDMYMDADITSTGDLVTAASCAKAVWDALLSEHLSSGSTGEALNAAGGAGDPWITTLPGGYTNSQAGAIIDKILKLSKLTFYTK